MVRGGYAIEATFQHSLCNKVADPGLFMIKSFIIIALENPYIDTDKAIEAFLGYSGSITIDPIILQRD